MHVHDWTLQIHGLFSLRGNALSLGNAFLVLFSCDLVWDTRIRRQLKELQSTSLHLSKETQENPTLCYT